MIDRLLTSGLFGSGAKSSTSQLALFSPDNGLDNVTKQLLNQRYNISSPSSVVKISDDIRQFITANVSESKAAKLLADIDSIDRFNRNQQERVNNPVGQLIGSESANRKQGNLLNLLT